MSSESLGEQLRGIKASDFGVAGTHEYERKASWNAAIDDCISITQFQSRQIIKAIEERALELEKLCPGGDAYVSFMGMAAAATAIVERMMK